MIHCMADFTEITETQSINDNTETGIQMPEWTARTSEMTQAEMTMSRIIKEDRKVSWRLLYYFF